MKKLITLIFVIALISITLVACKSKTVIYDYSIAEEKYNAEQALTVNKNGDDDKIEEGNKVKVWYKELLIKDKYIEGYMVIYESEYLFICVNTEVAGSSQDCNHEEFNLESDDYGCINFNNIAININKLEIVKKAVPSTRVIVEPLANQFLSSQKGTITDVYAKTEEDGDYEILLRTEEYGWYYEQMLGNEICARVFYSTNSLEFIIKDFGEHFKELVKIV